jgi:long-chain fatty acid transport protein
MRTTARCVIALCALGSAHLAASNPAEAGGFSTARFGGELGHAASDSVTSIYYNPAGLALGKGTRFYVEGTFAYRTVDYDRDEGAIDNPGTGTPSDVADANYGPAHLGNFIASPFLGAATDLGKRGLGLGVAIYVPFGGQAAWDKNPDYVGNTMYPGAQEGPARWANIEGAQRNLYVTLGAAIASPRRSVSVGVGVNLVVSEISLVRARTPLGTDDVIAEGRSLLEVSDVTVGLGLGATWKPTKKSVLGVSYQIKPGFGEMTLDGTLTNKFGTSPESEIPVELRQRMPDILRIAASIQASPQLTVRLAADWQRWSAFDNQCLIDTRIADASCRFNDDGSLDEAGGGSGVVVNLARDWNDTFGVRAGAGYALSPTMELGGSLSFDSNAVPDETMDPSLFDMNKVIAQAGGQVLVTDQVFVSATLGYVFYVSRTTEPRAVDPMAPSRNPDMAGSYSSGVALAMVGVGFKL